MKYVYVSLVAFVLYGSPTHAGTVTFDPLGSTKVLPNESIQFDVSVTASDELGTFNSVNILLGANELTIESFDYAQSWLDAVAFPPPPPISAGIYPSDLFVGGFLSTPVHSGLVGTLTVSTVGLELGVYSVVVDSENDTGISGLALDAAREGLFGIGVIIPEPTTLLLLGSNSSAICNDFHS